MVDPLSIVGVAEEGVSICIKVISILKRFISTVKNAKKDMIHLLKRVERIRNVLALLRYLMLELIKTSQRDMQLAMDISECEATMKDLMQLVNEVVAGRQQFVSFYWAAKKSAADKMVLRLREEEGHIMNIVTLIGTTTALKTHLDVEALKYEATAATEPKVAFDDVKVKNGTAQALDKDVGQLGLLNTWLGYVLLDGYTADYLNWRHQLSEAGYWGRWDDLWSILDVGKQVYHETWANAIRLKPVEEANRMSFWTPLHQAVYNRAPAEVVQKLIDAGAFRKDVKIKVDPVFFHQRDSTRARTRICFSHLFDILAPVIRNPVPHDVLTKLEEQFHDIILHDLGRLVETDGIYFPVLEVLTELGKQPMWFAVRSTYPGAGYLYQLDERSLTVRAYNMTGENVSQTYLITETETIKEEEMPMLKD